MSYLENSAKLLSEFGLTMYEAKVYLSVYKLGLASASDVSQQAGIRREEVYRTLPKLEKAGLVERVLGRPIKVRALPIDDVISVLIERKEQEANREISQLISKKNSLLELFQEVSTGSELEEESSHFTLLSDKDALNKRIELLIKTSRVSIDFADEFDNIFRFILNFSDDLLSAKKRELEVRIVTNGPENSDLIPELLKTQLIENSLDMRYSKTLSGSYIVFDRQQAIITTSTNSTIPDGGWLWTDDPNLVAIIQKDFDKTYTDAINWKDYKVTSDEKLMRILKHLKPRDHVILVYESEDAKHDTLFAYIENGLRKGDAAIYICSEESPDEIRMAMKRFGIDIETYESNNALRILPYTEMYIRDGVFDIEEVMEVWENSYDQAINEGFSGMRVTGEMSCFIKHDMVEELLEYEHALHTVLGIPMTAICAYNAEVLAKVDNPIDVYSELVKAHAKVLFAGKDRSIGKIEVRAS